ncbi:MAG: replication factor C large subunit [Candidatus Bathyarchaeia archaeon]
MSTKNMWTEKYRPTSTRDIVGNEDAKVKFLQWLKAWKRGAKAALLYGPPGVGKTALTHAAAAEYGYDIVEMNASDVRTEEAIEKIAGHAAGEASLLKFFSGSRGTLLLLDEVDGIHGRQDQGGVGALMRTIQNAGTPIVLTANDPTDPRLRELREYTHWIRFYEVRPPAIVGLLQRLCDLEGVETEKEALEALTVLSQGDVRSAVNDLQALADTNKTILVEDLREKTSRDKQFDVSKTLRHIFLAEDPHDARRALFNSTVDYDTLLLAIHDNLPLQYQTVEEVAEAYDHLSKADVIRGRIKRSQDWGLLGYVMEQMSMGVASARKEAYTAAAYRFPPERLIKLSRTRAVRQLRDNVAARIGEHAHVSKRRALQDYLPFLRIIFENDLEAAQNIASTLTLDEAAVTHLGGKPVAKPRARATPSRPQKK